jgi:hypothetical protein
LDWDGCGYIDAEEDIRHCRIGLAAFAAFYYIAGNLIAHCIIAHCIVVGVLGGNGDIGVGYSQDLGAQRHLLARGSIGVITSIIAFVVMADYAELPVSLMADPGR